MSKNSVMNEAKYRNDFDFIENQVHRAIQLFYMSDEVNSLAREKPEIFKYFNEAPSFWITQRYAFDVALYIELGKIFDVGVDALSVQDLVTATIKNPQFFSKAALSARKLEGREKPDWLETYMANVTEPTSLELEALRNSLAAVTKKMDKIYKPVRNKIIAHNIARDTVETELLFKKTDRKDIKDLLYFLYDLMQNLWHLYYNGRIPKLGTSNRDFDMRHRDETRRALKRLA